MRMTTWVNVLCCLTAIGFRRGIADDRVLPERNEELENKTIGLFEQLLAGYDRKIRPLFGTGRPVEVSVDVYLASFDNIHEEHMEYGVTVYLRQKWRDVRLRHAGDVPLPPTSHYVENLWVPDLIVSNAKRARFKDVTFLNRVVDIDEDGNVLYVCRLALQLSCAMDFHRFPMDTQACEIELESFEYTTGDVIYKWDLEMPIEYHHDHLKLPQYNLEGSNVHECERILRTGNYSCIGIKLLFSRKIGYYLLQTYIPSILLVVMSWVSFWIQIKGSPARVALGVTTVLTMITTTNGVRQNLPPVSYIKAIDVWFAVCLLFVTGALLEFAMVHYLVDHKPKLTLARLLNPIQAGHSEGEDGGQSSSAPGRRVPPAENGCISLTIDSLHAGRGNGSAAAGSTEPPVNSGRSLMTDRVGEPAESELDGTADKEGGGYDNHAHFELNTMTDRPSTQVIVNDQTLDYTPGVLHISGTCSAKKKQPYLGTGKRIDSICRWAFPLAFIIFNVGYWIGYIQESQTPQYIP